MTTDPTTPITFHVPAPAGNFRMTVKGTYRTDVHRNAYARLWGKTAGPVPRVTHLPGDPGTPRRASNPDDLEEQRKRELFSAWMHRGEAMRRNAKHFGQRTTRVRRENIA